MGEVAKENMPYKLAGSKVPVKDLSLVIELAKKQGDSDALFAAIREVYESLG